VACLGEGAYVNTLWTFPAAHREAGVTSKAENYNPLARSANCYHREKGPESPDVSLGFPPGSQSHPLGEEVGGAFR